MSVGTDDAIASVLLDAADKLRSHGVHWIVTRAHLPQGAAFSLHAAAEAQAAARSYVALGEGAGAAGSPKTAQAFAKVVDEVIRLDMVDKVPDWAPRHGRQPR